MPWSSDRTSKGRQLVRFPWRRRCCVLCLLTAKMLEHHRSVCDRFYFPTLRPVNSLFVKPRMGRRPQPQPQPQLLPQGGVAPEQQTTIASGKDSSPQGCATRYGLRATKRILPPRTWECSRAFETGRFRARTGQEGRLALLQSRPPRSAGETLRRITRGDCCTLRGLEPGVIGKSLEGWGVGSHSRTLRERPLKCVLYLLHDYDSRCSRSKTRVQYY